VKIKKSVAQSQRDEYLGEQDGVARHPVAGF
jgi:hypothetical protein